jgi:4-hydroxybutyrate dehydrogenase
MATLTFSTTTQFDFGAIQHLAGTLQQFGITRPLLCTDKGLMDLGLIDTIRQVIPNDINPTIFDGTPENPTQVAIEAAAEMYIENGCDGVLAVGGGSSIDLAKGVALRVSHEGPLMDYTAGVGGSGKIGEVAPLVAIPTTAGTGSEVSGGSVVIMKNGEKLIFSSTNLVPRTAICDPDLTLGLPPLLTAATGMDAVTHCIEAVLSPAVNPPAEAVGLDGLRRSIGEGHLKKATADGSDKDARWNMMMASTEGALAFTKGLGTVHSMSHACGALPHLRLHHGTLNAIFLPTLLRFNADAPGVQEKYTRLREAMRLDESTDLADYIEQLNADIGLPANLGAMGVTTDDFPFLIEHAAKDVCNFSNAKPVTPADFPALYEQALG